MKVKAIWEFEFDDSGLDPNQIDIPGVAKDAARCKLMYMLRKQELIADDFYYIIEEEKSEHDSVNHAEWKMEIIKFPSKPEDMYVKHACTNCGHTGHIEAFKVEAWEAYHKDHYKPELSKYCSECGYKMDLRELYEEYKYQWCLCRGRLYENVDEEVGINGECYASFDEWYQNEYLESRGE